MKNHVAIILKDKNKILFIQRSETKKILPNIWAFPSGTVEDKETIELTAVREAKEELGLKVMVEKILTIAELPEFDTRLHFVICTIKFGQPIIQEPNEIKTLRWLTFQEFFDEYRDDQIGHGLIYLRKHPEIWKTIKYGPFF